MCVFLSNACGVVAVLALLLLYYNDATYRMIQIIETTKISNVKCLGVECAAAALTLKLQSSQMQT